MRFTWKLSSNTNGSVNEANFFLFIQNSVMTILSIFIGLYPIFSRPVSLAQRWAQGWLAAIGVICAISAILFVPTYYLERFYILLWAGSTDFYGITTCNCRRFIICSLQGGLNCVNLGKLSRILKTLRMWLQRKLSKDY